MSTLISVGFVAAHHEVAVAPHTGPGVCNRRPVGGLSHPHRALVVQAGPVWHQAGLGNERSKGFAGSPESLGCFFDFRFPTLRQGVCDGHVGETPVVQFIVINGHTVLDAGALAYAYPMLTCPPRLLAWAASGAMGERVVSEYMTWTEYGCSGSENEMRCDRRHRVCGVLGRRASPALRSSSVASCFMLSASRGTVEMTTGVLRQVPAQYLRPDTPGARQLRRAEDVGGNHHHVSSHDPFLPRARVLHSNPGCPAPVQLDTAHQGAVPDEAAQPGCRRGSVRT